MSKKHPRLIDWILKETQFLKTPTDTALDTKIDYLSWLMKSIYPLFYEIIRAKIKRFFKYKFFSFLFWGQLFVNIFLIFSLIAIGAGSVYYAVVLAKSSISPPKPVEPKVVFRYELKTFEQLIKDIGAKEAGSNWKANRPGSQYIGWFQFGNSAFEACKVKGLDIDAYGKDKFLNNKHAQITWFCELFLLNKEYLADIIARWNMKKMPGVDGTITESGILMASHLVGSTPTRQFFENGGKLTKDMYDGNGVPLTHYIELFSGYNVDNIIYNNIP